MPDYRWSYYLTAPWELVGEWYRAVKFGIRNLIQWFPVIWGDRHYDSMWLFILIRRKLILMQRELRRNPYYVGADKHLHQMHVCELLITRLYEDAYRDYSQGRHREKWGEMRQFWEPAYDRETGDVDPNYCRWITDWPNAHTPEMEAKARKELHDYVDHGHKLRDQDIEYLFKLLNKHMLRWG